MRRTRAGRAGTRCTRVVRGGTDAAGPRAASRLTADHTHGEKRRERLAGSAYPVAAEVAPRWRLRGSLTGRREVDDDPAANGRRCDSGERRSVPRRYRRKRAHRAVACDKGRRANGSDSPEVARRRRIAAAATSGGRRGKRRRGHERSIPGGESIYATTGIRC
uniref:Uncharacterized protein n=1 Tax=Oryza sativa subsp. japonica TaxID=39947 RepID=Q6ES27_ORYSJ|nr:hypothetical protein [Oryza sativa Japonica Group]